MGAKRRAGPSSFCELIMKKEIVTVRTHFLPTKCYACDDRDVVGVTTRHEGTPIFGMNLHNPPFPAPACERHAETRVKYVTLCIYCSGPVSRAGILIDHYNKDGYFGEEWAHRSCYKEFCRY